MLFPRALVLSVLSVALGASPAAAVVVYDTYPAGQGTPSRLVGKPLDIGLNIQYADPFVVDGTSLQLESITLRLRHGAGASGDYRIFLRADNAGEPGTILEEWVVTDQFNDDTDVELVSVDHPPFTDGATYWINVKVIQTGGEDRASWVVSNDESDDWLFSEGGAIDPPWMSPPEVQPLGMATVEAPEPAQALLFVVGAALLAVRARRRF
jgi:hypothetical protein